MKKLKPILIFITIFILIVFLGFNYFSNKTITNAKKIPIEEINLNKLDDGEYLGNYNISPVKVSIKVTILNKKITNIELLEHFNGLGTPAEEILNKIIKKQSLQVDNISGATLSSIVIKKAIEDSLTNK